MYVFSNNILIQKYLTKGVCCIIIWNNKNNSRKQRGKKKKADNLEHIQFTEIFDVSYNTPCVYFFVLRFLSERKK